MLRATPGMRACTKSMSHHKPHTQPSQATRVQPPLSACLATRGRTPPIPSSQPRPPCASWRGQDSMGEAHDSKLGHDETFLGSRYTSRHARWAEKLMFCETWTHSRSFAVRKAEIDGKRVPVSGSLSSPNVWSQCLPSPYTRTVSTPSRGREEREKERKKIGPSHCCAQSPLQAHATNLRY